MTAGVISSAACFLVAVATEMAGIRDAPGSLTDLTAVFEGLVAVHPWAWASLGVFIVVATPVLGLLASAAEYADVRDWGTVWLALAVLAILAVAVAVAVLG